MRKIMRIVAAVLGIRIKLIVVDFYFTDAQMLIVKGLGAVATVTFAILGRFLHPNISFWIRCAVGQRRGKPPTKRPRILWVIFILSIVVMVISSILTIKSRDQPKSPATHQNIIIEGDISDSIIIQDSEGDISILPKSESPTPTQAPSETPTISEIPSSTLDSTTTTVVDSQSACIRADPEFWYASWITYPEDGEYPQMSRRQDNLKCYDFDSQGFIAEYHQESDAWRISIQCEVEGQKCSNENVIRGIYTQLPAGSYEFEVNIEEIEINRVSQGFNDVDLIIGLGDPITNNGEFIIFRLVHRNGYIHLCQLTGYMYNCTPPITTIDPTEFGIRKVNIEVGEETSISVENEQLVYIESTNPSYNKLWIGYSFRSRGSISAYIQFPYSLNSYLSIGQ